MVKYVTAFVALIIGILFIVQAQADIYNKQSIYNRYEEHSIYNKKDNYCQFPGITNKYDNYFKQAVYLHYPKGLKNAWCIAKAQCIAESGLDPKAKSPAGAQGLCQIMPSTWKELDKGHGRSPFSATWNIMYASIYMNKMFNFWIFERPIWNCRVNLALASYNAGPGSILKTQKESGGALCWEDMKELHRQRVKDDETYNYVEKIKKLL